MTSTDADRAVLRADAIARSYEGIPALQGVNLALRSGEVHALLGVDGAGKSTLVKILSGIQQPESGWLEVDNRRVVLPTPRVAATFGIRAVHQDVRLVPFMTVADNLVMDYAPRGRLPLLVDWHKVKAAARDVFDLLDTELDLQAVGSKLSTSQQQLTKIAKALIARPRILLLDEPTYSLTEADTTRLFRAIRTLARRGTTVLYVSQRLDEIPRVADRVSVIKEGRIIGAMSVDEADLRSVVEMLVAETSQAMALREADRLRREFVSMVSHELRTPLATIRGYAETVLSQEWSDAIRNECLENIAAGCERLTDLVDNLLDMSSLEKGTLRIDKEPISVPDLARRVALVKGKRKGRTQDIRVSFPPGLPAVSADPKRIEQVLYNLLDNAIKYSPPRSTITVTGAVDPDIGQIVVTVEDQGVGIAPEHLERVFERFYRVRDVETAGIEGSGLGLAICKSIVDRHGGRIWARSAAGRGSAFSFSLPIDDGDSMGPSR